MAKDDAEADDSYGEDEQDDIEAHAPKTTQSGRKTSKPKRM
jgi:hypothetical protein